MRQSLNFRNMDADNEPIVLIVIEHPDLLVPLLISTSPTVRLSDDPLAYGTRSTFASSPTAVRDFVYVAMEAVLPDEEDEGDPTATLVIDVLDSDIVKVLTSTIQPATARMALVLAKTPNVVEMAFTGLQLENASGDYGAVSLQFSAQPLLDEPVPFVRFSRERFPGMFK